MSGLSLENYTEKCIVVRGDSRNYVQELTDLGGKYTNILKKGDKVGWIFSKSKEQKLIKFIEEADENPKTGNKIVKNTPVQSSYSSSYSSSKLNSEDEKINLILNSFKKLNKKDKLLFMNYCFKNVTEEESVEQKKETTPETESEIVIDDGENDYDSSPPKKSLFRK